MHKILLDYFWNRHYYRVSRARFYKIIILKNYNWLKNNNKFVNSKKMEQILFKLMKKIKNFKKYFNN